MIRQLPQPVPPSKGLQRCSHPKRIRQGCPVMAPSYPPLEGEGRVGGLQAAVLDRTPMLCIGYGRTKLSFVRSGRGGVNCSSAPHHASSAAHPIPTCVALRATQHGRCETSAFYSDC